MPDAPCRIRQLDEFTAYITKDFLLLKVRVTRVPFEDMVGRTDCCFIIIVFLLIVPQLNLGLVENTFFWWLLIRTFLTELRSTFFTLICWHIFVREAVQAVVALWCFWQQIWLCLLTYVSEIAEELQWALLFSRWLFRWRLLYFCLWFLRLRCYSLWFGLAPLGRSALWGSRLGWILPQRLFLRRRRRCLGCFIRWR